MMMYDSICVILLICLDRIASNEGFMAVLQSLEDCVQLGRLL